MPASREPSPSSGSTRREFLKVSLAAAGTALLPLGAAAAAAEKGKRPNLIFFLGEGHRPDALSISGNPILKTPHHDRIAREGMRFTNAFCTNALCAPARAVALTGLYSRTSGALGNTDAGQPMPADIPIFTDLLHQAGYEVAIVGKVHVRGGVTDRYWDYYFGYNAPATNYYFPTFIEGRKGVMGAPVTYPEVYVEDLVTDRALQWLGQDRGEKPFCLLVWWTAPHAPFFRARRHLDLYNGIPIAKPVTFDDDLKGYPGKPRSFATAHNKIGPQTAAWAHDGAYRSLEEIVKDYYAGLVAVDDGIGRIMGHLEKTNQLDDTAILNTSDHGYFLGEWRMIDKRLMHEPSIRVPFMIRYPRRIPAGVVRDEMILDLDVAPTILDLAGVESPPHMQGRSVLPLAERADPGFRTEWCYEYFELGGIALCRGIRTERYKLIHYYHDTPEAFEMYDLQADPLERNNLQGLPQYAALQQHLRERLESLRAAIPERPKALA